MNPDDLVGLVAVALLFGGGTLFLLSISPVGKALAARILGRRAPVADDEETGEAVNELRREVEELRHVTDQMTEMGERVDFLERLLAKQREAERLPPVIER